MTPDITDDDGTVWEPVSPKPTEEQLTAAESSTRYYSAEEVLAFLRSLE